MAETLKAFSGDVHVGSPQKTPQTKPPARDEGAIVMRELSETGALEAYFRLRHEVYSAAGYLPRTGAIDIDPFDPCSRFLGACEASSGTLIAGTRMILPEGEPNGERVRAVAARNGMAIGERRSLYPSQAAFKAGWFFALCRNHGLKVAEFGRMVSRADQRHRGLGGMLVHAVHGLGIAHGLDLGFSSCPPHLTGFYGKLGCEVMGNLGVARIDGVDTDAVALLSDLRFLEAGGLPERCARELAHGEIRLTLRDGRLALGGAAACQTARQPD